MKVVHIVPALFSSSKGILGGAERYALELARHMAQVEPTELVTFGREDSTDRIGSLNVRVLGHARYVRGQRTNPFAPALIPVILSASVVHCHQKHIVASSLTAALRRLTGRRVFVSDLGGGGWDISSYCSTDNWYHGHLHISEYSRAISGHSSNPRSHVIFGGVDAVKFVPDASVIKRGTVLFVGRILPHKGINYLIEALPENVELQIVGEFYDAKFLIDLKTLARGRNVTFLQGCSDTDLVRAYQRAMCIVLPSVYVDMYGKETRVPELLGQTLMEGMACGLPAVCTNVASMPEIVIDGVNGFVVPPNDPRSLGQKLCWLRDHPEQALAMGRAGRQLVMKKFVWPKVVERCLQIYKNQESVV